MSLLCQLWIGDALTPSTQVRGVRLRRRSHSRPSASRCPGRDWSPAAGSDLPAPALGRAPPASHTEGGALNPGVPTAGLLFCSLSVPVCPSRRGRRPDVANEKGVGRPSSVIWTSPRLWASVPVLGRRVLHLMMSSLLPHSPNSHPLKTACFLPFLTCVLSAGSLASQTLGETTLGIPFSSGLWPLTSLCPPLHRL